MSVWRNDLWPGTTMGPGGRPKAGDYCRLHNCCSIAVWPDGSWRCLLCQTADEMYSAPGFVPLPCHKQDFERWQRGGFMARQIGFAA